MNNEKSDLEKSEEAIIRQIKENVDFREAVKVYIIFELTAENNIVKGEICDKQMYADCNVIDFIENECLEDNCDHNMVRNVAGFAAFTNNELIDKANYLCEKNYIDKNELDDLLVAMNNEDVRVVR